MWQQVFKKTIKVKDIGNEYGIMQIISLRSETKATWLTVDPQINKERHLYIRRCNMEIWNVIAEYYNEAEPFGRGVVLIGNPGIGKSWFLNYCLIKFAETEHSIVFESQISSMVYVFGIDGSVQAIDFADLRGNILQNILALLNSEDDVIYLVDAGGDKGEPKFTGCKAFAIVASSPNINHYNAFLKNIAGIKLYMPSWKRSEVESLITCISVDDEESVRIMDRYDIFGGILRYIMKDRPCYKAELFHHAISINYDDLVKCLNGIEHVDELSHVLFSYDIRSNPDLRKKYQIGVTISYASKYVERLITTNLLTSNLRSMNFTEQTLRDPFASSIRGNIFEVVAHKRLCRGGCFPVSSLGFDSGTKKLEMPNLDKVKFFNDLSEVKNVGYYIPNTPNFPVVDAFAVVKRAKHGRTRIIGFQMTIRKVHPLQLKTALAKNVINKISDIYFVVPSEMATDYPEQKCKGVKKNFKDNTRQWSLSMSVS